MVIKVTLVSLFLFSFSFLAYADTIYLKNGRAIEGIISKETESGISLDIGSGVLKFYKDQIENIERSSSEGARLIRQKWSNRQAADQARALEILEKADHEPKLVAINEQSGHLIVETLLNKKVKVKLMLDTGASLIVLSNRAASGLRIPVSNDPRDYLFLAMADGRKVGARRVILDSVNVQGSELRRVEAAVLLKEESNLLSADGLLGMSFLKKFSFKIDRKNNKLVLEKI
ncbi:MAG: TIGR02281 family clan AA aspartic protease [Candidatus Omnitrophota bacterium]